MEPLIKKAQELLAAVKKDAAKLGIDKLEEQREKMRVEMARPDFWQDVDRAKQLSKQEADMGKKIQPWKELLTETESLAYLAKSGDDSLKPEVSEQLAQAGKKYDELKRELRFQGPYDDHSVILSIYAGAGGTDAQDWAEMLLRMYTRWAQSHNLNVKVIDQSAGEEAGIKSAQLEISGGSYLYGKLAGEHGVHRLVRLSPFNADHLRQTSFAKVEVLPLIDTQDEVKLDEKDLKIDVYRAGGHGGQSVNTTDSAVRITHLPTGVSVAIQNERSQLQNKQKALDILRSKLVHLKIEQHADNLADIKGLNQSAEWGNQIRNYVLHPYKQVKDTRSGYESSEVEKVLDGDLDPLISSYQELPQKI